MAKTQTESINLPAGTQPGTRNFPITLTPGYKTCRGFYIIRNNGTDYLRVGINDTNGTPVSDPAPIKHFEVEKSVEITRRFFKDTPFKANGGRITISVQNFTANQAAMDFDVMLLLDNNE